MSTIARSLLALTIFASAAHGQTSTSYDYRSNSDQSRLLQPPPARAIGSQPTVIRSDQPVRRATYTEPIKPLHNETPIPLQTSDNTKPLRPGASREGKRGSATTTIISSLAVVLGAFFVLVWLSRKTTPKGLAPLPNEVFESLGRAPLTGRQQMQLIRLGNKLVLLSVTPTGAESLAEVTDVDEVNRLAGLCQQGKSGSISESFRNVLSQYAEEPAPGGFTGDPNISQVDVANRANRRQQRRGAM